MVQNNAKDDGTVAFAIEDLTYRLVSVRTLLEKAMSEINWAAVAEAFEVLTGEEFKLESEDIDEEQEPNALEDAMPIEGLQEHETDMSATDGDVLNAIADRVFKQIMEKFPNQTPNDEGSEPTQKAVPEVPEEVTEEKVSGGAGEYSGKIVNKKKLNLDRSKPCAPDFVEAIGDEQDEQRKQSNAEKAQNIEIRESRPGGSFKYQCSKCGKEYESVVEISVATDPKNPRQRGYCDDCAKAGPEQPIV